MKAKDVSTTTISRWLVVPLPSVDDDDDDDDDDVMAEDEVTDDGAGNCTCNSVEGFSREGFL